MQEEIIIVEGKVKKRPFLLNSLNSFEFYFERTKDPVYKGKNPKSKLVKKAVEYAKHLQRVCIDSDRDLGIIKGDRIIAECDPNDKRFIAGRYLPIKVHRLSKEDKEGKIVATYYNYRDNRKLDLKFI